MRGLIIFLLLAGSLTIGVLFVNKSQNSVNIKSPTNTNISNTENLPQNKSIPSPEIKTDNKWWLVFDLYNKVTDKYSSGMWPATTKEECLKKATEYTTGNSKGYYKCLNGCVKKNTAIQCKEYCNDKGCFENYTDLEGFSLPVVSKS